jgi:hypothetical protein
MAEIKVSIRQSSGEQFDVTVLSSATVGELKSACIDGCKLPVESQRLIFKGTLHMSSIY